jgi:hypothetical protein
VQIDRTIPNNKPDIIIRNNEKRTCLLIAVAISGDRNVIKNKAEKILKYKDLTIAIQRMWNVKTSGDRNVIKNKAEKILKYKDLTIAIRVQRMWNVKTKVIPVTIGATGTISKSLRKYVSNIPGQHEVKELQKTAILGTAHLLQKVLT